MSVVWFLINRRDDGYQELAGGLFASIILLFVGYWGYQVGHQLAGVFLIGVGMLIFVLILKRAFPTHL